MNQRQIASLYRQVSAVGSNPLGLVVRLYDSILDDFNDALLALDGRDPEARTNALNHALLIIANLESALDHENGGIVARHLDGFYKVTRGLILDANISPSREKIGRLVGLYSPVRKAWSQAEAAVASGKVTVSGSTSTPEPPLSGDPGKRGAALPENTPTPNWRA